MLYMIKYDEHAQQSVPPMGPSDVELGAFLNEEHPGPTLKDFRIAFVKKRGSETWNRAASKIFEISYRHCVAQGQWLPNGVTEELVQNRDIALLFMRKVRGLRAKFFVDPPTEDEWKKIVRKGRRNSRRHAVSFTMFSMLNPASSQAAFSPAT
jgi:hypothetical protein